MGTRTNKRCRALPHRMAPAALGVLVERRRPAHRKWHGGLLPARPEVDWPVFLRSHRQAGLLASAPGPPPYTSLQRGVELFVGMASKICEIEKRRARTDICATPWSTPTTCSHCSRNDSVGPRGPLRSAMFDYIEAFCNRRRRHSALGCLSPEEFERRWHNCKKGLMLTAKT